MSIVRLGNRASQAIMKCVIDLSVNGANVHREVEPRTLLVQFLRENLGLTGTHIGCETSLCGACTVHLNGKAVKSCTVLAPQADGASITTVEGLAGAAADQGIRTESGLHPVQEGFRQCHGLQCGFCTPGMIMAAADLLQRNADPSEGEIRHALEGNYCRCTGYQHIVQAVQYASERV